MPECPESTPHELVPQQERRKGHSTITAKVKKGKLDVLFPKIPKKLHVFVVSFCVRALFWSCNMRRFNIRVRFLSVLVKLWSLKCSEVFQIDGFVLDWRFCFWTKLFFCFIFSWFFKYLHSLKIYELSEVYLI